MQTWQFAPFMIVISPLFVKKTESLVCGATYFVAAQNCYKMM